MNKETLTATASEKQNAKAFSDNILANSIETNSILASGQVRYAFRTHYANLETEEFGIESLLVSIFKEHDAIFPLEAGDKTSALREVVIAASFYTEDLHALVVEKFGPNRYPIETIRHYLSNLLSRDRKANGSTIPAIVGKVQLTGIEDFERTCPKPRCKWFLLKSADKTA